MNYSLHDIRHWSDVNEVLRSILALGLLLGVNFVRCIQGCSRRWWRDDVPALTIKTQTLAGADSTFLALTTVSLGCDYMMRCERGVVDLFTVTARATVIRAR